MMKFTKDYTDLIWNTECDSTDEFIEKECKTYSDLGELFTQMMMANRDPQTTAEAKALIGKMIRQYITENE